MTFQLPALPFSKDGLEPHMSQRTLDFHHDEHHRAYVTTLNKLVIGTGFADRSLEDIIRATAADESRAPIFNNAAQSWNHAFFWQCLRPGGGGEPGSALLQRIERDFGGFSKFKEQFKEAAIGQFGSGWAWLVADGAKLKVTKTANAANPLVQGQTALLACDVWEHAYYLDFQHRRTDFVQTFLDHLVNWDFVARNLAQLDRR
jgi:Fe-Mn family superoxide dismutase